MFEGSILCPRKRLDGQGHFFSISICSVQFSQQQQKAETSLAIVFIAVVQACDQHTSRQIQKLAESQVADEVNFLRQMHQCWENHTSQMLTIRSIFLYLDRSYVLSASSVRSLYEMGLQQFRLHLVQHAEVIFCFSMASLAILLRRMSTIILHLMIDLARQLGNQTAGGQVNRPLQIAIMQQSLSNTMCDLM